MSSTWMTMERNACTATGVDGRKREPSCVLKTIKFTYKYTTVTMKSWMRSGVSMSIFQAMQQRRGL